MTCAVNCASVACLTLEGQKHHWEVDLFFAASIWRTKDSGRISVQVFSTQSKHSLRLPRGPTVVQPAGISRKAGHKEYWPSSFTNTRYSPFSSSNGFVIEKTPPGYSFMSVGTEKYNTNMNLDGSRISNEHGMNEKSN
jgi:hypothetical protein